MGVKATAEATIGRAQVCLNGTPLTASFSGPTIEAGAGLHASHIGAHIGSHLGEAQVGPFAVRAGFKFGAGIENGIPVVHSGPVSTVACCIQ